MTADDALWRDPARYEFLTDVLCLFAAESIPEVGWIIAAHRILPHDAGPIFAYVDIRYHANPGVTHHVSVAVIRDGLDRIRQGPVENMTEQWRGVILAADRVNDARLLDKFTAASIVDAALFGAISQTHPA